jgi:hypothetical protein
LDVGGDAVTVQRGEDERLEDEQVKRALQELDALVV